MMREFCREQKAMFFEIGKAGIEHVLLPEQGIVLPGQVVIGGDSHTCTYGAIGAFATGVGSTDLAAAMATGDLWMKVPPTIKFVYHGNLGKWVGGKDLILHTIGDIGVDGALYSAMEFTGEAIDALSMDGRFTMANMAIEAGGKAGIFRVDNKTQLYIKARAQQSYNVYEPDPDAEYAKVIEYNIAELEPQVAFPHLPANAKPVSQAGDIEIDQVIIGSCTNGRLEDLKLAAQVLKGKKVHKNVRCIIIPGSQQVYIDALNERLIEIFIEADAAVSTPTCGPCFGGHTGVLAEGERCVSTTNRNFVGRMGHPKSEVYLANPAVAAASAVAGRIINPDEIAK
jgi:3-isopropylmalate/(R)-2-methylmalate dehydratase large subunit